MPDPIALHWNRSPFTKDEARPQHVGTFGSFEAAQDAIRRDRPATDVFIVTRERGSSDYEVHQYQFNWTISSPFNLPDLEELELGEAGRYEELFVFDTDGQMGVPQRERGFFGKYWAVAPADFGRNGRIRHSWGEWDAYDIDTVPTTKPANNPAPQLAPPK